MKEVRWVMQNNLIAENDVQRMKDVCKQLDIEFFEMKVLPFSSELPDFPIDDKVNIYYGSTTLMNNVYNQLKPEGLFYNHETFSMENYISQWGENMLNSDARILPLKDFLLEEHDPEENFFIRPDGDGKEFDGQVAQFKSIGIWMERALKYESNFTLESKILVGPAYNIHKEWRNYIVNGKVVTSSLYRKNFKLKKCGDDIPEDMIKFVEARIKEYSPAAAFAMDIASTHDGTYYIIECGCINSVGLYDCNVGRLINKLQNYLTDNEYFYGYVSGLYDGIITGRLEQYYCLHKELTFGCEYLTIGQSYEIEEGRTIRWNENTGMVSLRKDDYGWEEIVVITENENTMERKIEGYWFEKPYSTHSKPSSYPMPIPNILTEEEAKRVYDLIVQKETTAKVARFRGFSSSRITGEMLGCAEYHNDEWLWPSDFAKHYVLENKVKPTDEFLEYIGYKN